MKVSQVNGMSSSKTTLHFRRAYGFEDYIIFWDALIELSAGNDILLALHVYFLVQAGVVTAMLIRLPSSTECNSAKLHIYELGIPGAELTR